MYEICYIQFPAHLWTLGMFYNTCMLPLHRVSASLLMHMLVTWFRSDVVCAIVQAWQPTMLWSLLHPHCMSSVVVLSYIWLSLDTNQCCKGYHCANRCLHFEWFSFLTCIPSTAVGKDILLHLKDICVYNRLVYIGSGSYWAWIHYSGMGVGVECACFSCTP